MQQGKYKIVGRLGQGSFGITYLAAAKIKMTGALGEMETEIHVAVKEFFMSDINSRSHDGTGVEGSSGTVFTNYRRKFRKEAENLARLSHDNIVHVIDVFDENNTTYYVMQYVDGGSLDDYIASQGRLSEGETFAILRDVGAALSYMHRHKMLHLDLKPKNIMRRGSDGHIFLIDFGLSKYFTEGGEPESSTTIGHGTPGYAPLEQARYRHDGSFPATIDVYALGATAFKMLTGKRPPEASDILNDGFPSDDLLSQGISSSTVESIRRAMSAERRSRYQTVDEFLSALCPADASAAEDTVFDDAATVVTVTAQPVQKTAQPAQPAQPARTPASAPRPSFFVRHKGLLAAVCVVVFAVVGFVLFRGGGSGDILDIPESITVSPATGSVDGHDYVDMGLSVMWATCNLGASSLSDYGDYFAWGETTTKSEYTSDNCKTWEKNIGDIAGNPKYDAARANWGGSWRMPTEAEMAELIDNCTWTWTDNLIINCGDVNIITLTCGYKVTSKINGNSIFLPAAGWRYGSSLIYAGEFGYYWSATPYESDTQNACGLYFDSGYHYVDWSYRYNGHGVRPVCNVNDSDSEVSVAAEQTRQTEEKRKQEEATQKQREQELAAQKRREEEAAKQARLAEEKRRQEEVAEQARLAEERRRQEESAKLQTTTGTIAGHDYVDLGLSVKWATCNVGASSPSAYGNYYAWGETTTKSTYTEYNNKTDNKNIGNIAGNPAYDAARANWGGSWRMPTEAEMEELINKCTWTWTSQGGHNGYKVTSKTNGNSIFLPAAGWRKESSIMNAGDGGGYWSSAPFEGDAQVSCRLFFYNGYHDTVWYYRYSGQNVRPVSE